MGLTQGRADNISHPVLKAIFKYKNHPSIAPTKNVATREKFEFLEVSFEDVVREIWKYKESCPEH